MSIAGNYTPESWSNGSTLLNSITMTKITDAIKALDEISSRSLDVNFFDDRDYFYYRNIIHLDDFYNTWTGIGVTATSDTTNFILHYNSTRITVPGSSSGSMSAYKNLSSSVDCTKFQDLSSSSTSDFVVFNLYISDKTKFDYVFIRIGYDSSNFYYVAIIIDDNTNISNGWNTIQVKKSDFTLSGSMPSGWSNINFLRIDVDYKASSTGAYCSFQYLTIVRVDPVYSDYSNIFQKFNGSTWENIYEYYDDYYHMDIDYATLGFSSPSIVKMNFNNTDKTQLKLKTNVKNFFGKFYFGIKKANYCPMITLYSDDDNYICIYINNQVLTIFKRINASETTIQSTKNLTFSANDKVYYNIEKTNSVLSIKAKTGSSISFVETTVSGIDLLFDLYLGGSSSITSLNYSYLYDMLISNTNICSFGSSGTIT